MFCSLVLVELNENSSTLGDSIAGEIIPSRVKILSLILLNFVFFVFFSSNLKLLEFLGFLKTPNALVNLCCTYELPNLPCLWVFDFLKSLNNEKAEGIRSFYLWLLILGTKVLSIFEKLIIYLVLSGEEHDTITDASFSKLMPRFIARKWISSRF